MSEKSLFPVIEVPEVRVDKNRNDERYRKSLAWDISNGDFVKNGANQIVESNGRDTYRNWCFKSAVTERYSCLSYPNEIGVEMESALKEPTEAAVESAIERTVTEALLVNPRTEYVRGFSFVRNGDEIRVNCRIKGIGWEEFPLEFVINRSGGK